MTSKIQPNQKLLLWKTAFVFRESALLIFLTSIAITLCHCRLLCYCVAEAEENVDFALCTKLMYILSVLHFVGFADTGLVLNGND